MSAFACLTLAAVVRSPLGLAVVLTALDDTAADSADESGCACIVLALAAMRLCPSTVEHVALCQLSQIARRDCSAHRSTGETFVHQERFQT